ncbi:MAG: flagellin [Phycisphaerae bacterium]|nr:flagellin [Phycisphaerae bacterium]
MSRINTNIPALQATHRLIANQSDLTTRLERLSTGLRINRGKDDPAGLIASETLRNEIRGIEAALSNSQRAINVLSVAEGALNEVSSLLLDMQQLIVTSANDGAISDTELQANQLQIDSILESIDRIANTTQFGGDKLLNGEMAYTLSGVNSNNIVTVTTFGARLPDNASRSVQVEVTTSAQQALLSYTGATVSQNVSFELASESGLEVFSFASGTSIANIATAVNGATSLTGVTASATATTLTLTSTNYGTDAYISVKALDGDFIATQGSSTTDRGQNAGVLINGQSAFVKGKTASLRANGFDVVVDLTAAFATLAGSATTSFQITGGGAKFQIGPDVNTAGRVDIGIPSVSISNLGNNDVGYLNTVKSGGVNSVISKNYQTAEEILDEAISQTAIIRGRIGGLQKNQIESNVNSQRVALENVTAAESVIRDADYASEVSKMTRSQILVQSTTQILGLSNQLPQSVLSLLG